MKNFRFLILFLILAFTLPYTYGGCGGGGGGSDSGLVYSGLTGPAELTDANAEDISGGALGAGLIGDGMSEGLPGASVAHGSAAYHVQNLRSVKIPQILSSSLESIDFTSASPGGVQANAQSASATIYDGCGGSMSYTVSYNAATGVFSGRFNFSNYGCDGTTISGGASFSGIIDVNTENFIEADFSFYSLSGGELTLDGDLSIDYTVSPPQITFNAYGQDPISGLIYWIDNYILTIDEDNVDPVEIEMSGRFCHPEHGCVTLSTEVTFEFFNDDEWPTAGRLLVTGANNTKVRLEAQNNTTCRVYVENDGDDDFDDWVSGDMNWEDL